MAALASGMTGMTDEEILLLAFYRLRVGFRMVASQRDPDKT